MSLLPSPLPATSCACCSEGKRRVWSLGVPGVGQQRREEQEEVGVQGKAGGPSGSEKGKQAAHPGKVRGRDVSGRRGELWTRVWRLDLQVTVQRIRWHWWPFRLLRAQKSWKGPEPARRSRI